ncbi:MAG: PKD domain-containing protein [Candidatus Cloacimonadales bacterium]|jgi:hypothetical protein|nr:PKD domain-containing protein [Candidatus Cloacimonadales bacterium]
MKLKIFLILLITILAICLLEASNYLVKLEGGGDFNSIQAAILNASTNGDTIIVYPGRYQENLDYLGKNITVTSLYRYTNNREDIYNTIIDGNQQGSCIIFMNGETRDAIINGFTIEKGSGFITATWVIGGGIVIRDSSPTISNCIIQNNTSKSGGGISIESYQNIIAHPLLSGNIIKNNKCMKEGGGIAITYLPMVEFDPINKNSVFCNSAGMGHDIFGLAVGYEYNVVLDTFTVATPDPAFISFESTLNFECDHAFYDSFINQDVYVSPDGSDSNDGLSPSSPFQTIHWAAYRIAADSLNPKTIHLAPGVYSKSLNNQQFFINMRSYVHLKGAGMDLSVLDGENEFNLIMSAYNCNNYKISDLTMCNTPGPTAAIYVYSSEGIELQQIKFDNLRQGMMNYLTRNRYFNPNSVFKAKDLIFQNGSGHMLSCWARYNYISNIVIKGNRPYLGSDNFFVGPSPFALGGEILNVPYRFYHDIYQGLFYDNEGYLSPQWPNRIASSCIEIRNNAEVRLINSTLSENFVSHRGGPILLNSYKTSLDIYNSIIYDNTPCYIFFEKVPSPTEPNRLGVFYSNIEYGQEAIREKYPSTGYSNIVEWGDGNIDSPPLFVDDFDNPYQIGEGSPCIDAGTLDIPNFVFSEFDIMGNPRIVGSSIDMGAYEFQGMNVNFSASPLYGKVPLEVQFMDQSIGEIFSWAWDFDLDGTIDSYEQNPVYTYTLPGTYSVKLIINNGEKSIVKENYIEVEQTSLDDICLPPISAISNPYPNPFRGKTLMDFQVNDPGMVNITVYNVKGQRVRKLMDRHSENAYYHIVWDGYDDKGKKASSGIYTMQIKYKNKVVDIKKVTLIK